MGKIYINDRECEWEGLPKQMEELLIRLIRRGHAYVVSSMSLSDGSSYFLSLGGTTSMNFDNQNLKEILRWAVGENVELDSNVTLLLHETDDVKPL